MKSTIKKFALSNLVILGLVSGPVLADDDMQQMKLISEKLGLISLEQAKGKALEAKPGTIIDAELDDRDFSDSWDYEFEILDSEGKEWDVDVDAKTGEVVKMSKDWF